ncbi:MAG: type III-B CRISPR-associated protein Cas10/Cmr2 [Myxococcales bacterium]|nr:type III-B CRISPR-associated protein Cas10/Cmr2 [Myxococcales bacterium]
MDKKTLFQNKIRQWLHDPPNKAYALTYFGGHKKVAISLREVMTDGSGTSPDELTGAEPRPDRIDAGANRPVVDVPGMFRVMRMDRLGLVTHPLAPGARLSIMHSGAMGPPDPDTIRDTKQTQEQAVTQFGLKPGDWDNEGALYNLHGTLWRKMVHELSRVQQNKGNSPISAATEDVLWAFLPSDTRCPDVSIWDHLRVSTAAAFVSGKIGKKAVEPPAEETPCLFRFQVRSPGRWIEQARTGRDLWVTSFLISELAFAAMEPIVEVYGPDAILYPDLRGNARMDRWLWEKGHKTWLPEFRENIKTFAALIPNSFVALIPQGKEPTDPKNDLLFVKTLGEQCEKALKKRWKSLSDTVLDYLQTEWQKKGGGNWTPIWDRQLKNPPQASWVCVPWMMPERLDPAQLGDLGDKTKPRPLLPFQDQTRVFSVPTETREVLEQRAARLRDWIGDETWANSESARDVFLRVNLPLLQNERGFDYAYHHEMLGRLHEIRNRSQRFEGTVEKGEKCTQCGQLEALYDLNSATKGTGSGDSHRQVVRGFWAKVDDEDQGKTRLCGRCAFVKYLIPAGGETLGINTIWGGDERKADKDGKVRVPFPSTAAIAAQDTLVALAKSQDRAVLQAVRKLVSAAQRADRPQTQFPRSLRRLQEADQATNDPTMQELFKYDAQILFPETITQKNEDKLRAASKELRDAMKKANLPKPNTHIAVVRMDGDSLGKLLAGHPGAMKIAWRDVLNPQLVAWIEQFHRTKKLPPEDQKSFQPWIEKLVGAGWETLLDRTRMMGPSLHAFISRVLAEFGHSIVPWVTEAEFGGRLIYSGGDDLLAILPADQTLAYVTRIQQLYRAPWIVDTQPDTDAWGWRKQGGSIMSAESARQRYLIPTIDRGKPLALPISEVLRHPTDGPGSELLPSPQRGRVIPMMGPNQTLSASIVYGHFKTDMAQLLREGKRMLDQDAKDVEGKGALAIALHSRSGIKARMVGRFGDVADYHHLTEVLGRVIRGFATDNLAGRLPYKLHTLSEFAKVSMGEGRAEGQPVAGGLFPYRKIPNPRVLVGFAEGEVKDRELLQDVLTLWELGFAWGDSPVGPLKLCRSLASLGGD